MKPNLELKLLEYNYQQFFIELGKHFHLLVLINQGTENKTQVEQNMRNRFPQNNLFLVLTEIQK